MKTECFSFPWFQRFFGGRRPEPARGEVARLAGEIAGRSLLCTWVLTAAGLPRRNRRAMLELAVRAVSGNEGDLRAPEIAALMAQDEWHDAVLDELFRRQGMEPLSAEQRCGRGARARLARLRECLEGGVEYAAAA